MAAAISAKLTADMWPSWQEALTATIVTTIVSVIARPIPNRIVRYVGRFCGEFAFVSFLYMLWRLAKYLHFIHDEGAAERGRQIFRLEHTLRFPSELAMERWVLKFDWLSRGANSFYASFHVPALLTFLAWLFIRHRDRYNPWRNTLAITTAFCLVIRWYRVAPPRLLPDLGFVDMALKFNQSVYGPAGTGVSDQNAAMPSIHCAWAILIGIAVIRVSPSKWRWAFLLHPVLTVLAVVVTANHWWLDGVVAAMLIGIAWSIDWGCRRLAAAIRTKWGHAPPAAEDAEPDEPPESRSEPEPALA